MYRRAMILLLAISPSGCAAAAYGSSGPDGSHYGGAVYAGIPYGHLPPPGSCRVWVPGRPPGHQPPPVDCYRARRQVTAGAWVVYTPYHRAGYAQVWAYDAPYGYGHPPRLRSIRYVDRHNGRFIRGRGYDRRYGYDRNRRRDKDEYKGKGRYDDDYDRDYDDGYDRGRGRDRDWYDD